MLQNNAKAGSVRVDIIAIDALFKRIAERGRKVRAQAIDDKEKTSKYPKDMSLEKDNQKVGK